MKTYFVDAFTNKMFAGNPAAVCLVNDFPSEITMQSIATEVGFSETAFVRNLSGSKYEIRFFTPKKEIPLCGHATLAASKVIFETTELNQLSFVNIEKIELAIAKVGSKIQMQFPIYDLVEIEVPTTTLSALGLNTVVTQKYSSQNRIILLEINDTTTLKNLQPDFIALAKSYSGINGVLVTAKSQDSIYDFHYRYFWPWAGTNEDPVTGGVQTFLTKYWAEKLNKNRLNAFQSSQRTGEMITELANEKVYIYGEAVIVLEGNFRI
jgi:PhzF family phenazine biosynthesis protein